MEKLTKKHKHTHNTTHTFMIKKCLKKIYKKINKKQKRIIWLINKTKKINKRHGSFISFAVGQFELGLDTFFSFVKMLLQSAVNFVLVLLSEGFNCYWTFWIYSLHFFICNYFCSENIAEAEYHCIVYQRVWWKFGERQVYVSLDL